MVFENKCFNQLGQNPFKGGYLLSKNTIKRNTGLWMKICDFDDDVFLCKIYNNKTKFEFFYSRKRKTWNKSPENWLICLKS